MIAVNSTIRGNPPRARASAAGGAVLHRDPDQPAVVRPRAASAQPSSAASARRASAGLRSCFRAPSGNGGDRPKMTFLGRDGPPPGPPGGWGGGGPRARPGGGGGRPPPPPPPAPPRPAP